MPGLGIQQGQTRQNSAFLELSFWCGRTGNDENDQKVNIALEGDVLWLKTEQDTEDLE